MNDDDMAELEIEDTRPLRAQEVEDRLQQLRAELEVNGRLNAALAQAAGIEARELPEELLREIEEVTARVHAVEPLSPADLSEALHRELKEIDERREPPSAGTE